MSEKQNVYVFGDGLIGKAAKQHLSKINEIRLVSVSNKLKISSTPPNVHIRDIFEALIPLYGKPNLVINAIGVIGKPNVDWCEDHREETKYGNVDLPMALAEESIKLGAAFLHVSTGCIFNDDTGKKIFIPYKDTPNFEDSYYSWSKAEGERGLQSVFSNANKDATIELHRIRMPFWGKRDPRNLLDKIISYPTLVDAPNSMTSLDDYAEYVAERAVRLISYPSGFYTRHAVNSGGITHKEIVALLREHSSVEIGEKTYVSPAELRSMTRAPRTNCVLGRAVLPDIKISMLTAIKSYG